MVKDQKRLSRLAVFRADSLQLLADNGLDFFVRAEQVFQLCDLFFQTVRFLQAVQQELFIDVAQLDLRHILGLHLIDAEADHEVRDDLRVELRFADDADGLVDIEKNFAKTLEKMQLVLLLLQLVVHPPLDAFAAPRRPLLKNLAHTHDPRHAADENVEVAAEAVLQRRCFEKLLHELLGLCAAL